LIWFFNSDCFASGCLTISALVFVSGFLAGGAVFVAGGAAFAAFAAGLGEGFFFIAAPAPLAVAAFACDFAGGLAFAGAALPCGFLLFLGLVFVAITPSSIYRLMLTPEASGFNILNSAFRRFTRWGKFEAK
jgi:hypothetical protein